MTSPPLPPSPPPLELVGVALRYPGAARPVVEGISLTVAPGELTAVLGSSGSGKTSLLRAVAGLFTPCAGEIRLQGAPVARGGRELVPAERRGVGLVFQDYALFPHMTVRENVGFGLPRSQRAARVAELVCAQGLEGLADLLDRRPGELSGGQQQRVAVARALAPRPALLLLDEPFANLDAELRADLGVELRRTLAAAGASALFVTHDRAEALGLADRVAVLGPCAGQAGPATLLQCDTPEAVYRRPATACAATLTGKVALVDAQGEPDGVHATTPLGRVRLARAEAGPLRAVLRPEDLRFRVSPSGRSRVVARRFEGCRYGLTIESPAGLVDAMWPDPEAPAAGTRGDIEVPGAVWTLPV